MTLTPADRAALASLANASWPLADLVALVTGWRVDRSAVEIGQDMKRTKNAVVGKAHRLQRLGILAPRLSPIIRDAVPKPLPVPCMAPALPPLASTTKAKARTAAVNAAKRGAAAVTWARALGVQSRARQEAREAEAPEPSTAILAPVEREPVAWGAIEPEWTEAAITDGGVPYVMSTWRQCQRFLGAYVGINTLVCGGQVDAPGSAWCEDCRKLAFVRHAGQRAAAFPEGRTWVAAGAVA